MLNLFFGFGITVLTVRGVLNDKYRATALEPSSSIVDVSMEDENGVLNWETAYKSISLSEAAKLQNATTGSLELVNVICNCGARCKDDGRCKCWKANKMCTSHCHSKMKGKSLCCVNRDKKGKK